MRDRPAAVVAKIKIGGASACGIAAAVLRSDAVPAWPRPTGESRARSVDPAA